MLIKPQKDIYAMIIMLYGCSGLAAGLFWAAFQSWDIVLVTMCLSMVIIMRFWIAVGRTLKFTCKGITISFLWIKRDVLWEDFIKRREYLCRNTLGYKNISQGGIEFLTVQQHRVPTISPVLYCFLYHPFTYVFLDYRLPEKAQTSVQYAQYYPIEKEVLFATLKDMGIDIIRLV